MFRRFSLLILSLTIGLALQAQDFYDLNTVQTIEITFAESNWDALLDAQKNGDEDYIMAQSVTINGTVLDSVGVKYKGNSTYSANQVKNPFHIELDTYKEQDYDGYKDIKLSNVANDPSFLREVLSYQILRQYTVAPQSNYANVYVNGNLIGLYSNSEAISKSFVKQYFYSKKNTFVKCNPPDGAGQGTTDLPNLVYLGNDSTSYYDAYELKSDAGWDELIDLCDTLSNNFSHIEKILDVDRALWMLAFDNALVNLDSYIGQFSQNYYLYRDDNGVFIPVVWDLNESFGRFSQTGSSSLNTTASKQTMSHLLHSSDSDFPLLKQLLSNATYKRMYIAHMKTMLEENFENGSYYQTGLDLQMVIDASVQADNNKFFTYSAFQSNLTSDYSTSTGGSRPGMQTSGTPGITNLMDARSSYLLGLSDFTQSAPTISDVTYSNDSPTVGDEVTLSVTISDANNVILAYRFNEEKLFEKVQMDGSGIYTYDVQMDGAALQYYIYAENDNAGMFSPQRAQHEFYSLNTSTEVVETGDVVINEFMASNSTTAADQDGEFNDWIELYNNSSVSVDLSGYYLSDDAEDLMQWTLPEGTEIAGNGYLIIWADKDEEQDGLHANFKLSATGETIYLSDSYGEIVDLIAFTDQNTDMSYARIPNGTGDFIVTAPSFGTENSTTASNDDIESSTNSLTVYPNPSSGIITIQLNSVTTSQTIQIYNATGAVVKQLNLNNESTVDVSSWIPGIYYIKSEDKVQKLIVH